LTLLGLSIRSDVMAEPVLVTGAAGFIGFHVAKRLVEGGQRVVGLDNLNAYYDPAVKRDRLAALPGNGRFTFEQLDLGDRPVVAGLFERHRFPLVVHLAAQAGVRYSVDNPPAYADANLSGFTNVLEGCRQHGCRHLVYASSSSVYGANTRLPFRTSDNVDHPLSFYAATKKANELMAHTYAHVFGLPTTGLRFFTAYGPWGRPDMAMWLFAKAIFAGEPVRLFKDGRMRRDYTYIDDVVDAIAGLVGHIPVPDPSWSGDAPNPATSPAPWRVYNIGNTTALETSYVLGLLEEAIGRKAREALPMQAGDVPDTCADISDLTAATGFRPKTAIEDGVERFVAWFRDYHRL
jgi:UDP-glucuronate 4-epimerase